MGALDDGVGPDTDQAVRLCALLGLDPEETASIRVVIESGTGAVVEWTGRRRMSLARLAEGLAIALEPDDPPESKWQVGPDPWATWHESEYTGALAPHPGRREDCKVCPPC